MRPNQLRWDDPRLAPKDPPIRQKYRLLQSWYRENRLGADHGFRLSKGVKVPTGSLLAEHEVVANPLLNFFNDPVIGAYVDERVPVVKAGGGTLEEERLRHNMLSSMPMAFSLAAKLRAASDRDQIVSSLFGLGEIKVTDVHAEWAPDPKIHLNDKTAFDIAVWYLGESGLGMVGIETKYTEPLSLKEYDTPTYRKVTDECGWFVPECAEALMHKSTNQLWRNAMLAASIGRVGGMTTHLAVIGLDEDRSLWSSVDSLQKHLASPDRVVRVPWQGLCSVLDGGPDGATSLAELSVDLANRYIDLSQVPTSHE